MSSLRRWAICTRTAPLFWNLLPYYLVNPAIKISLSESTTVTESFSHWATLHRRAGGGRGSALYWYWIASTKLHVLVFLVYFLSGVWLSKWCQNAITNYSLQCRNYCTIDRNRYGGVGYFSNEGRFSVESSFQGISSTRNLLSWTRNDSSVTVVMWT